MVIHLLENKLGVKVQKKIYVYIVGKKAKGRILKREFQENKARQIFRKNENFLPPDTHMYVCVSGGKKCLFFGKFGVLCFLETPVLRFSLLAYYRRYVGLQSIIW